MEIKVKVANSKEVEDIYIEPEEHVYEEIGDYLKTEPKNKMEEESAPSLEISKPTGTSQRVRWVDIMEVTDSGLLEKLDTSEIALQEAKYEIVTSEASYFKSLLIVEAVFITNSELKSALKDIDHFTLFSNILKVKQCSERFLVELLDGWQNDLMLGYLCKSVSKFVESGAFQVYIDCCANQMKIEKTLEYLKLTNPAFIRTLSELEADPVCQMFTLQSFLTLPMQRVTRLPMLVQAILRKLTADSPECEPWKKVLIQLQEVANECNEAVGKADTVTVAQYHQLKLLNSKVSSLRWKIESQEKKRQQSALWNLFRIKR